MEKIDLMEKIETTFKNGHEGTIYRSVIDTAEKLLIQKALLRAHGNQINAARILGLNRNTLRAKIKHLRIDPGKYKL